MQQAKTFSVVARSGIEQCVDHTIVESKPARGRRRDQGLELKPLTARLPNALVD